MLRHMTRYLVSQVWYTLSNSSIIAINLAITMIFLFLFVSASKFLCYFWYESVLGKCISHSHQEDDLYIYIYMLTVKTCQHRE